MITWPTTGLFFTKIIQCCDGWFCSEVNRRQNEVYPQSRSQWKSLLHHGWRLFHHEDSAEERSRLFTPALSWIHTCKHALTHIHVHACNIYKSFMLQPHLHVSTDYPHFPRFSVFWCCPLGMVLLNSLVKTAPIRWQKIWNFEVLCI